MTLTEARRFVEACWQERSMAGVCARTGLDRRRVSNTAAAMRRRGVSIPPLATERERRPPGMTKDEWKQLQRYAEACKAALAIQRMRSKSDG